MKPDQLSALIERFSLQAGVFYNGTLCGIARFEEEQQGYIHLLRRGRMRVRLSDGTTLPVSGPCLMYCPRALAHRFEVEEEEEVELTCASVRIQNGFNNPITRAIPDIVILQCAELPHAKPLLDFLVAEAATYQDGRVAALNRLFELVIIQVLRFLISQGKASSGLLAGLADPRIALALEAVHEHPDSAWTIELMASTAGMSRARFADHFRNVVQLTPLNYVTDWRLTLAQQMLLAGRSMQLIASEVGYESSSALARAFRRRLGFSPIAWLDSQRKLKAA
jgi:AraC-like DNA-binding protein